MIGVECYLVSFRCSFEMCTLEGRLTQLIYIHNVDLVRSLWGEENIMKEVAQAKKCC